MGYLGLKRDPGYVVNVIETTHVLQGAPIMTCYKKLIGLAGMALATPLIFSASVMAGPTPWPNPQPIPRPIPTPYPIPQPIPRFPNPQPIPTPIPRCDPRVCDPIKLEQLERIQMPEQLANPVLRDTINQGQFQEVERIR